MDELYRIFNTLNRDFYDEKLNPPVITIQKSKKNSLGYFTVDRVWRQKDREDDEARASYELNINPTYLNAPAADIVGTMQHEMVHYANLVSGIKDCSGNVHNKKFKELAERVGLIVTKGSSNGWGCTEVGDDFRKYIIDTVKPDDGAFMYFRREEAIEKAKPAKKIFKYSCPHCDLEVKAKKGHKIICGDCKCELVMEDEE